MKKLFYLFAVLFISATTLMAQPSKGNQKTNYTPETRAMMRLDRLSQTVTLSEKERSEVLALFTQQEEQRAKQKAEQESKREAAKKASSEERQKNNAELKSIIGEEKFTAYETACKEKHKASKECSNNKKGPNRK